MMRLLFLLSVLFLVGLAMSDVWVPGTHYVGNSVRFVNTGDYPGSSFYLVTSNIGEQHNSSMPVAENQWYPLTGYKFNPYWLVMKQADGKEATARIERVSALPDYDSRNDVLQSYKITYISASGELRLEEVKSTEDYLWVVMLAVAVISGAGIWLSKRGNK